MLLICGYSLKFYSGIFYIFSKKRLVGFRFLIVRLKAFFEDLCKNLFNGFFSMMNQIESCLAFLRMTIDIKSYC